MVDVFISVRDVNAQDVKWIDTRFSLQDVEAGRIKYAQSHIADAIYWDLERDLSDMTKTAGRHPLPGKEALTNLFRRSGLELTDSVVIYDDGGNPFAARAWWLLQYAGFTDSFIALEGFERIKELGIPVNSRLPEPVATNVSPQWDEKIYASREFVEGIVSRKTEGNLLDARSAERYRGEQEPIDPIAGRIPHALNFDWERLKKDGEFNMDETVKTEISKVVAPTEEVTVYCGSGVTAAPLYAMLKQNGYEHVRLYVGSYSDWISKEEANIEKG